MAMLWRSSTNTLLFLILCTSDVSAQSVPNESLNIAEIELHCPADAKVWINNKPTTSLGAHRTFRSPMPDGLTRIYQIAATISRPDSNGLQVSRRASLSVQLTPTGRFIAKLPESKFRRIETLNGGVIASNRTSDDEVTIAADSNGTNEAASRFAFNTAELIVYYKSNRQGIIEEITFPSDASEEIHVIDTSRSEFPVPGSFNVFMPYIDTEGDKVEANFEAPVTIRFDNENASTGMAYGIIKSKDKSDATDLRNVIKDLVDEPIPKSAVKVRGRVWLRTGELIELKKPILIKLEPKPAPVLLTRLE